MSRTEELYAILLGLAKKSAPHAALPSYRALAERYGVNIVILREALARMEGAGHIYRIPRKGCYIAPPRRDRVILVVHNVRYDKSGEEVVDYEYEHFFYSLSRAAWGPDSRYAVIPVQLPEALANLADLPLVHPGLCGIVFYANTPVAEATLEGALVHGAPVLYVGSDARRAGMDSEALKRVHTLYWREKDVAQQMAEYLARNGHTRIGMIERRPHSYPDERVQCMREAMPVARSFFIDGSANDAAQFRDFAAGLTAVCAPHDYLAIRAMNLAVRLGYRIPAELSFIGFGNNKYCRFSVCPLASVDLPLARAGRDCIRLLEMKEADRPGRQCMTLKVIAHESVADRSKECTAVVG